MKLKTIIFAAAVIMPVAMFGSEDMAAMAEQYYSVAGRYTDFMPRIFNFLIFAGLTYYLVASPIKEFFVGRRDGIAGQLDEIEQKVQEAKNIRKNAEQAVEDCKVKAQEIASDTDAELELLKEKFANQTERELSLLEKQFEEKEDLEQRKMVRETIDEVLNENLTADDIPMSSEGVVNIISKKVA